jgi:hypothetical protein
MTTNVRMDAMNGMHIMRTDMMPETVISIVHVLDLVRHHRENVGMPDAGALEPGRGPIQVIDREQTINGEDLIESPELITSLLFY